MIPTAIVVVCTIIDFVAIAIAGSAWLYGQLDFGFVVQLGTVLALTANAVASTDREDDR